MACLLRPRSAMATPPNVPNERRKAGNDRRTKSGGFDPRRTRFGIGPLLIFVAALLAINLLITPRGPTQLGYSELKGRIRQGQVARATLTTTTITAVPRDSVGPKGRVVWRATACSSSRSGTRGRRPAA